MQTKPEKDKEEKKVKVNKEILEAKMCAKEKQVTDKKIIRK